MLYKKVKKEIIEEYKWIIDGNYVICYLTPISFSLINRHLHSPPHIKLRVFQSTPASCSVNSCVHITSMNGIMWSRIQWWRKKIKIKKVSHCQVLTLYNVLAIYCWIRRLLRRGCSGCCTCCMTNLSRGRWALSVSEKYELRPQIEEILKYYLNRPNTYR